MPTYEYKCNACRHRFELFHSIKDSPKRKCPKCGKNALERLIGTGAAVLFKGSGFYQTDYRSDSYKKGAEAASNDGKPKAEPAGAAKPAADTAKASSSSDQESPKPPAAKPSPPEQASKSASKSRRSRSA
jgi:putative FmdB family regulatory protein